MSKNLTIEEFEEIKEKVENQRARVEQKKGELKQIEKMIKEEFGCHTIEEAEKLLQDKLEKQPKLENRLNRKTEELQKLWGEYDGE